MTVVHGSAGSIGSIGSTGVVRRIKIRKRREVLIAFRAVVRVMLLS